ncbi:MAG: exosortase U, partial [Verrucomicrobia bacterium]
MDRSFPVSWRSGKLGRGGLALLALGYVPLLIAFFGNLWTKEHYQFFPVALAGAAILARGRWMEVARPLQPGAALVYVPLLLISFGLVIGGTLLWSPWLGAVAAYLGLCATVWALGGRKLFLALLPALIVLAIVIPPPLGFDQTFTLWLRRVATVWSSHWLDAIGLVHSPSGNVIEIANQRLLVEEACSGINSVLSTAAACLFFTFWRRRSYVQVFSALLLTMSFVLLGNVVRITTGAWLIHNYQLDILTGWRHQAVGMVMFVAYLCLILSLDHLLAFLFSPVPTRARSTPTGAAPQVATIAPAPVSVVIPAPSVAQPAPTAPIETIAPTPAGFFGLPRGLVWAALAAFAVLGVLQSVHGLTRFFQDRKLARIPDTALIAGASFTLPENIGGWHTVATVPKEQKAETMGVYSKIWNFQRGNTIASVGLDYPFTGYHDVTLCYTLQGWETRDKHIQISDAEKKVPSEIEVAMKKDFMKYGTLWFSTVDQYGRWQDRGELSQTLTGRFANQVDAATTYRVLVTST